MATTRRRWMRTTAGLLVPAALAPAPGCSDLVYEPLPTGGVPESIAATVKWIETTSRGEVFAVAARAFADGLSVEQFLAAMLVAASRTLPLRPVEGWLHPLFTQHAVHQMSLTADAPDRLVPCFFSLDIYHSARAQNASLFNDWLTEVPALPEADAARAAFREAMDAWDADAADAAIIALHRALPASDVIEELIVYACRDLAPIGHHVICVSQVLQALETAGWELGEIPLRAVVHGLFEHDASDPTVSSFAAARERVLSGGWEDSAPDDGVTREVLAEVRAASSEAAASSVATILEQGGAPSSVLDGLLLACAELLLRFPDGSAVFPAFHALTNANGFRHVFRAATDPATRLLAILQQAAFIPLDRAEAVRRARADDSALQIDTWQPGPAPATIDEVFEALGGDRLEGAAQALGWLVDGGSEDAFIATARRIALAKGAEEHDYKLPVAVFEEHAHLAAVWRPRLLAATSVYLRAGSDSDWSGLEEAREAIAAAGAG